MSITRAASTLNQNIIKPVNLVDNQTITGDRNNLQHITSTPKIKTSSQYYYEIQQNTNCEMVANDDFKINNDKQKSTRFLGNHAVSILLKWFHTNKDYPYPDEATTDRLAKEADISCKQVKKWFANKRVRSQLCCKPVHRNRKRSSATIQNDNNQQRSITPINRIQTQLISPPSTSLINAQQQQQQQHQQQYNQNIYKPVTTAFPPQQLQQQHQNQNTSLIRQMPLIYNPLLMMNVLASSSPLYSQQPQQQIKNINYLPSLPIIPQQQVQASQQQQQQHQQQLYYQNLIKEYLQQQQQHQQRLIHGSINDTNNKNNNNNKNDSIYYGDDNDDDDDDEDNHDENSYLLESKLNSNQIDIDEDEESIDIESINNQNDDEIHHKNNKENLNENNKLLNLKKEFESSTGSTCTASSSSSSSSSAYADSFTNNNGIINRSTKISSSSPISSVSPYSSISGSSSASSSSSNTPNTQIYIDSSNHSNDNRVIGKKKFENKKINFAVIASLID